MTRLRLAMLVFLASCTPDHLSTVSREPLLSISDGGTAADSLAALGQGSPPMVLFSLPAPTTTSCSLSYDDGYVCGAPHPVVTPALYHSGGIWEPVQTANIHVKFVGTVRAFQMRSTGALLCSGSLGSVTGYLNGAQVASVANSLISPTDCGADDVTFGVKGAFATGVSIDSVVITGVSPWQFMVQGAQGRALLKYTLEYIQESGSLQVACQPQPVVRTSEPTCTASIQGSGFTLDVTGWKFDATSGGTVVRTNGVTTSSWSGKVVTPGAVTVQANINGAPATATTHLSVTARPWSGILSLKDHLVIPTIFDSRPDSMGALGQTAHDLVVDPDEPGYLGEVSDDGPNHGYRYFTGLPFITRTRSQVNDLAINGTSPFYQIQESKRKKIGGLWYCPKTTVFNNGALGVLYGLVVKHEGAVMPNPDIRPNSHPAIYRKHADTAAQARFESLVELGSVPEILPPLQEVASGANFDSYAMHNDGRNYVTAQALGNCTEFHFGPYP